MKKKSRLFRCFSPKRSFFEAGLLAGFTDLHGHYLPGVDDGFQQPEDVSAALTALRDWGVKRVYCTPHVMADLPNNRADFLRERFEAFAETVPEGIETRLAAEYMLDDKFRERWDEGLLPLAGNHVLIEMSYLYPSPELEQVVYELQLQNYVPLLAHPERYLFLGERAYVRLKERGCRYQLNLMSLAGQYGVRAREVAWFLLENGLYDFAGTDMHHLGVFRHAMERLRLTAPEVDRLRNLIRQNDLLW